MKKRITVLLLCCCMVLSLFAGLSMTASAAVAVTGIQTAGLTKIEVGQTVKWTASVLPANATDKYLYWVAGNPGVATVDQNGVITGKKAGLCNITITAKNGVRKTLLLTVGNVPVTGIKTAGKTKVNVGERVKWTASVVPSNATDSALWWTAGNPGVATVDQNGNITAKKAGKCNITVTAKNGVKKTVMITVQSDGSENWKPDISFTTVDLNGKTWTDSCFAGHKLTVINYWAYWCGPCVNEMPDLQRLSEKYASKGVQFLGLYKSSDESGNKQTVRRLGITYPCLRSTYAFRSYINSGYIPETIFVDGNGKVLGSSYVGGRSYSEWESIIQNHLR